MIALDTLIESTKISIPTLPTKQEQEKQRRFVGWLVNLRDEVGGDVQVDADVMKAASGWIDPVVYAERLK